MSRAESRSSRPAGRILRLLLLAPPALMCGQANWARPLHSLTRHGTLDWPEGSYAVYYYDGSNPPVGDMRCR